MMLHHCNLPPLEMLKQRARVLQVQESSAALRGSSSLRVLIDSCAMLLAYRPLGVCDSDHVEYTIAPCPQCGLVLDGKITIQFVSK